VGLSAVGFACGSERLQLTLGKSLFSYGYLLPVSKIVLSLSLRVPPLLQRQLQETGCSCWRRHFLNRDKPNFSSPLLPEVSCVSSGGLLGISLLAVTWENSHVLLHKNIPRVHLQESPHLGCGCTAFEADLKLRWLRSSPALLFPEIFFPLGASTFWSCPGRTAGAFCVRIVCGQLSFLKCLTEQI